MSIARVISMTDSPIQRVLREPGLVVVVGMCGAYKTALCEWIVANRGGSVFNLNEMLARIKALGASDSAVREQVAAKLNGMRDKAIDERNVSVGDLNLRRDFLNHSRAYTIVAHDAYPADVILAVEDHGHKCTAVALKCDPYDAGWSFDFTVGLK